MLPIGDYWHLVLRFIQGWSPWLNRLVLSCCHPGKRSLSCWWATTLLARAPSLIGKFKLIYRPHKNFSERKPTQMWLTNTKSQKIMFTSLLLLQNNTVLIDYIEINTDNRGLQQKLLPRISIQYWNHNIISLCHSVVFLNGFPHAWCTNTSHSHLPDLLTSNFVTVVCGKPFPACSFAEFGVGRTSLACTEPWLQPHLTALG